ncbi:MAG: SDR family NAD(P)-dependent oxidoreductase [Proteobacteria bacterium]|nr:SDR family NAD(P)-dependent oxidoreductase [Pseudomonadota bacterium]
MTDSAIETGASEKIAIVGMAGRFPSARTVDQFWRLIASERMGTRWFTEEELLAEGVSQAELADPAYVRAANYVPDMECFDAGFFGFSPREASILDPQHRHFLEVSWEAFEDAGHMPENFDGRVGVFAGSGMQAYMPFNLLTNPDLVEEIGMFLLRHTGNDKDFLTTRLSYLLNLQGPSVNVQTACSTSLVAVHQAAASLLSMECDMALAGGVTIELPHRHGYKFAGGEILSPDGRCRAFDNDSQGTVFGSGAAVVILRRLEDAIADGDDIRAVLLGSAVNNDGAQKAGYLAPSVDGQAEAAAEALAIAGVDADTVTYVEAHGTGTPVGDPIELAALSQVYEAGGTGFCGIGSVKTNVGHLDTAAGTVSLIKVVESLRHETIPASLHYETPNERFDIASSPFYVVDKSQPWPRQEAPRRAAVNSLGVGGTNAHAIVEEAPLRPKTVHEDIWRILPFSARTPDTLEGLRQKWCGFLDDNEELPVLADAAYTLKHGRREFNSRMAVVAKDGSSLSEAMSGQLSSRVAKGTAPKGNPDVVFMFPGGGAQYPGAGAGLLESSETFKAAVDDCFSQMPDDAPADLRMMMFERALTDDAAREKLEMSGYAIPALFILEYAYARMWQGWGIEPSAVFGHSAGEYAAAAIANVMSVRDALKIVTWRGKVMDAAAAGAMSVIPASRDKTLELVGDSLDIAALNARDLCVVSGEVSEIDALESRLAGTEYEPTRVRINVAAHSRILDDQLDNFRGGIQDVSLKAPEIPFVSSLRGDWADEGDFETIDYWVNHLRHTVLFADAVETILKKPNQIILEVGPGQTLGPLTQMSEAENSPLAVLASGRLPKDTEDDYVVALTTAGAIWAHGGKLDWSKLPGANSGQKVSLPTYAFAKERHWIEPGTGAKQAEETAISHPVELKRAENPEDWYQTLHWVDAPLPPESPVRNQVWLVFHGDDPLSEALIQELKSRDCVCYVVRPGSEFSVGEQAYRVRPGVSEDYEELLAKFPKQPTHISHHWALGEMRPGSQDCLFDSGFCLTRAIQSADPAENIHLTFVGSGSVSVKDEAVTNPELATLLGPVRVAPREISGLSTQYIDIEEAADFKGMAMLLLEEHDVGAMEDRIAYRQGARYTEQLASLKTEVTAEVPKKLSRSGCYVITGGLSGIGLALADYLGKTVQGRIALLGRTAMPEQSNWDEIVKETPGSSEARAIMTIRDITAAGGEVLTVAADVADTESLAKALNQIREKFGEVSGLFHGAGIIDDAPLMMKSLEDAHRVMSAKVDGGRNLSTLMPDGSIDFFAVFSSTSVITAPPGQVDYVAANAYLESLAASREDGLAISWGAWRDIGMASRAYGGIEGSDKGPHPLLGPKQFAEDGTISFTTLYDPEALWVLNEHIVGGVPVLPGTGYIEMVQAAMASAFEGKAWEMQSLSLASPLAFPDNRRLHVTVSLIPEDKGYEFRVESAATPDGAQTEHCRALVKTIRKSDQELPATFQKPCETSLSEKSGHDSQENLIDFGPRWDNIGDIRTGTDVIEADFRLADEFIADLEVYCAHPGLTDEAATIGLNLLADVGTEGAFYAPMSVERIRILGPLTKSLKSKAKMVAQTPKRFASFDVVIFDDTGNAVMILEGFALRRVEGSSFEADEGSSALVDKIISQGIKASEAPEIFARLLNSENRQALVSPTSILDLRREMMRGAAPRKKAAASDGEALTADYGNAVEQKIAEFWRDLLGVEQPQPDDDFFDLGGHSLAAVRLFAKIRKEYETDLPLATLFEAPTLRQLSEVVVSEGAIDLGTVSGDSEQPVSEPAKKGWTPLVQITKGEDGLKPLYLVHGAGGDVLTFRSLSSYLDPRLPFLALRAKGSSGDIEIDETIEEMAATYLKAVREHQPEGPYSLGGYSGGGNIAYEMAQQLVASGETVDQIILFDTLSADALIDPPGLLRRLWEIRHWGIKDVLSWPKRKIENYIAQAIFKKSNLTKVVEDHVAAGERIPAELIEHRMTTNYVQAEHNYEPKPYDGDIVILRALKVKTEFLAVGRNLGWDNLVSGEITVYDFNCNHFDMMQDPTIGAIGDVLNHTLLDD